MLDTNFKRYCFWSCLEIIFDSLVIFVLGMCAFVPSDSVFYWKLRFSMMTFAILMLICFVFSHKYFKKTYQFKKSANTIIVKKQRDVE